MSRLILVAVFAVAVFGCRNIERNPLDGFRGKVSCQQPRVSLRFVRPTGNDSLLVSGIDGFFAKRPAAMDSLASACHITAREAGEGWRLIGVFEDSARNLHMVYFNKYQHEVIMAGKKIHFCFDHNRELREIFVYEVPLE